MPTPEKNAKLLPEVKTYMDKNKIYQVLNKHVMDMIGMANGAAGLPEEPMAWLAQRLEASAGGASSGGPLAPTKLVTSFATTAEVRDAFVEYFKSQAAHTFWASSPVVPHDDPTLLFINAGMNQFKPLFLGRCQEGTAMSKLKRAANSQKCIRAGGKHNDLDDVGKDNYHHTFFEMLGNWSFGDYFKEEAIKWAWTLLTEVYKIPADRLYVTYFEGNEKLGVPADTEAADIWAKYVPRERILTGNMKDNFWEMGDTGPCGPCSEIHYDRIGGRDASHLVNDGCVGRNGQPIPATGSVVKGHTVGVADPNVLEIWNNVFMQFNREKDGSLTPLPAPCVDTGMGLERVSSILLGKTSNYEIDVFTRLFDAIYKVLPEGKPKTVPYEDKYDDDDPQGIFMAYRVVADHIRTLSFAITDGAVPSNEGRGYVLRRILRRAVRFGGEKLDAPVGFFHQLVDTLVEVLGDAFPELKKDPARVKDVIKEEELSFSSTLKRGVAELEKRCAKLPKGGELGGDDAFFLYDSAGFPFDLTELMCEEKGYTVDKASYEAAMAKAKELSKKSANFSADLVIEMAADEVDTLKTKKAIPPTDDSAKWVWDSAAATGEPLGTPVRAIIDSGKQWLESVDGGVPLVGVVTEKTPFYAEAGGQVADTGTLVTASGCTFAVSDVKKFGAYVLHIGKVEAGTLTVGDDATLTVDYARRAPIAKNHTSTHMVNLALKKALGKACDQRGSLCDADKLRFDFAYNKPLTPDELKATQEHVNAQIAAKLEVHTQVSALDDAQKINGLRAVFGEQYPDPVRVLAIGGPGVSQMIEAPTTGEWEQYSTEFCGGTHVKNAGEIGKFALITEEGLGKGVRRVLGFTDKKAEAAFAEADALRKRVAAAAALAADKLSAEANELDKVWNGAQIPAFDKKELRDEIDKLKKKVVDASKGNAKANTDAAKAEAEALADAAQGKKFVVALLKTEADAKIVEAALAAMAAKLPAAALLVLGKGKAACALGVVPKDLEGTIAANEWVNTALAKIGGKGGGKPARAQGQARDPSNIAEAEAAAIAYATEKFG